MFDIISILIHVLVYASLVGIKDTHNSLSTAFCARFHNHRLFDPIFVVDESQFCLKPTPVFVDIANTDTVCVADNGKVPFHLQACFPGEARLTTVTNGTFIFPSCPTRDIVHPVVDIGFTLDKDIKENSNALLFERPFLVQGQAFGPVDFTSFMANASHFTVDTPIHTAPKAVDYAKTKKTAYLVCTLDMLITLDSICHVRPPSFLAEVLAEVVTPDHHQAGFHQTAIKIILVMLFSLVAIIHTNLLRYIAMQAEEIAVSRRHICMTFDADTHDDSQTRGSLIQQDDHLPSLGLAIENVAAVPVALDVADPSTIALPPSPQLSPMEVEVTLPLPAPSITADPIDQLPTLDDVAQLITSAVVTATITEESALHAVTGSENVADVQDVPKILGSSVYGNIFEFDLRNDLAGLFSSTASTVSLSDGTASTLSSPQQVNSSQPRDVFESPPSSIEPPLLAIALSAIDVTEPSMITLLPSPSFSPIDIALLSVLTVSPVVTEPIEHISTLDDVIQPIISTIITEEPVMEVAIIEADVANAQAIHEAEKPSLSLLSPINIALPVTPPVRPVADYIEQLSTLEDAIQPSTSTVVIEELEVLTASEHVVGVQDVPNATDPLAITVPLSPPLSPIDVLVPLVLPAPSLIHNPIDYLSTLDDVAHPTASTVALVVSDEVSPKVLEASIYSNVLGVDLHDGPTGLFTPAASTISLSGDSPSSVSSSQECNACSPGDMSNSSPSSTGSTRPKVALPVLDIAEPSTIVPLPSPPLSLIDVALPSMLPICPSSPTPSTTYRHRITSLNRVPALSPSPPPLFLWPHNRRHRPRLPPTPTIPLGSMLVARSSRSLTPAACDYSRARSGRQCPTTRRSIIQPLAQFLPLQHPS